MVQHGFHHSRMHALGYECANHVDGERAIHIFVRRRSRSVRAARWASNRRVESRAKGSSGFARLSVYERSTINGSSSIYTNRCPSIWKAASRQPLISSH